MSNAAWGAVVGRQQKETDERVLEAYKISKVGDSKLSLGYLHSIIICNSRMFS